MNGWFRKAAAVLFSFVLWMPGAYAQAEEGGGAVCRMQVYIAQDAMDEAESGRLLNLLSGRFPQAEWEIVREEDLRTLVLLDCAPQLAVCSPGEIMPWAKEGMLLALDGYVQNVPRMQRQVVSPCVWQEKLYMAPLFAQHRQMAVNRRMIERAQFAYMLDERAHPVWYPSEMTQVLEGCMLADMLPMEIWAPEQGDSLALEAMIQALYGGYFLSEDGEICRADDTAILSGLQWLADMTDCGMIGIARDRETALNRFLSGETAVFIDWSQQEQQRHAQRMEARGLEIAAMPYPSSLGVPVRAFEMTGLSAFDSEDPQKNMLALKAVNYISGDAKAQLMMGSGKIYKDDAVWLTCLDADEYGATTRRLLMDMIGDVMDREKRAEEALRLFVSAMEAARGN